MSDPSDVPIVQMLRELNKDMRRETFKLLILPLMVQLIRTHIKNKFGDLQIVAVFGPYADNEAILHYIAQKIATKGSLAIMGRGFYHPKDQTKFYEITELLPPMINDLLGLPMLQFFLYRYIIPSVVDKSTINLYPIRTNAYELEGCFEKGLPLLGYIIDGRVAKTGKDCPYLTSDCTSEGTAQMCESHDWTKCPAKAPNPPTCPFHDIADIPLVQKQWFMTEPKWSLASVSNLDKIDGYLQELLDAPYSS
jgi:hypothetical protein